MLLKARTQLLFPKQVRAHVYTIFADDIGVTVVIYPPGRSVLYGTFNDIGPLSHTAPQTRWGSTFLTRRWTWPVCLSLLNP